MQSYIYIILCIYYEKFAEAKVNRFVVGNHVIENDLMDLRIAEHENEPSLESLYQPKSYQVKRLTRNETKQIQNKNMKEINEYLEYLITKRQMELLSNMEYYEQYLKKTITNHSHIVDNYSSNLKRYFNRTFNEEDAINDIDKQFVILDLMETSNKFLFDTERRLINNMTDNSNVSNAVNDGLQSAYYKLLDDLNKEIINNKKEEMKNICEIFDICRIFPTYSDYVSDLLCEIVNFSDERVDNIVTQVTLLIKEKINFFRDFLGDELTSAVGDKLDSLFRVQTLELREVLSVLRRILDHRHKFSRRKSKAIKAKAIRVLIDIVDKTFEKDDDEVITMYIRITKKGLRDWSDMKENNIADILANFIRYSFNNLKYHWTPDTKKEVKTLLEVLMKSKVTSEDVYQYLLSKGSQYVNSKKNTDFYLDLF